MRNLLLVVMLVMTTFIGGCGSHPPTQNSPPAQHVAAPAAPAPVPATPPPALCPAAAQRAALPAAAQFALRGVDALFWVLAPEGQVADFLLTEGIRAVKKDRCAELPMWAQLALIGVGS